MLKRKRTKTDWWLLGMLIAALLLAVILGGLATLSPAGRSPYVRQAAAKGTVQWPVNVTSRQGKTLRELAAEAPSVVEGKQGKQPDPAEANRRMYSLEPVGRVQVIGPEGQAGHIPVLTREQAFQVIRGFRGNVTAAGYEK